MLSPDFWPAWRRLKRREDESNRLDFVSGVRPGRRFDAAQELGNGGR
jgi:hypothetical protein